MSKTRNVAILVFDDVEVLDFTGPFEVFSVAGRNREAQPFNVYLVAEKAGSVIGRGGFSVNPHYTFADAPAPDILLVPGGYGTRREMNNPVVLDWIKQHFPNVELLLSVCTGSLVLGKAGLLAGLNATTHFGAYDLLREISPSTRVCPGERFLDNGKVITSAGVSAGIDMSFHVISRLMGAEEAKETAQYIEYEYWS